METRTKRKNRNLKMPAAQIHAMRAPCTFAPDARRQAAINDVRVGKHMKLNDPEITQARRLGKLTTADIRASVHVPHVKIRVEEIEAAMATGELMQRQAGRMLLDYASKASPDFQIDQSTLDALSLQLWQDVCRYDITDAAADTYFDTHTEPDVSIDLALCELIHALEIHDSEWPAECRPAEATTGYYDRLAGMGADYHAQCVERFAKGKRNPWR